MEKMIVTRALDERDLLIKKINDAIDRASFVAVKKTSDDVVIGGKKSVQEFDDEARADLQSIRDLISRYNRLDAAILLANATTDIEVAGVTMTRAAAINLRKTLLGRSFSNTNFDDALIRKINNDFTKAKMAINKSQENADRQKEAMSTALASSDKKVLSDDLSLIHI